MKKLLSTLVACTMLTSGTAANAQSHSNPYVTPAATPAHVWSGSLTLSKGAIITVNCDITVTLSGPNNAGDGVAGSHTDEANSTVTVDISAGDATCDELWSTVDGGWSYSSNMLTLHNVYVNTFLVPGNCRDDIDITWNAGAQTLSVNDSMNPDTPLTGSCTLFGTLSRTSGATVGFHP